MKSRKVIILLVTFVIITAVLAMYYLNHRDKTKDGFVKLVVNEKIHTIDLSKLEYNQVVGTRMNGKGEEIEVDAPGIALKELFNEFHVKEYSKVLVVSDDAYQAEIEKNEINKSDTVYFLYEENQLRLVVFGDTNSKRSVSNVVQIIVK